MAPHLVMLAQRARPIDPHPFVDALGMKDMLAIQNLDGLHVLQFAVTDRAHLLLLAWALGLVLGSLYLFDPSAGQTFEVGVRGDTDKHILELGP